MVKEVSSSEAVVIRNYSGIQLFLFSVVSLIIIHRWNIHVVTKSDIILPSSLDNVQKHPNSTLVLKDEIQFLSNTIELISDRIKRAEERNTRSSQIDISPKPSASSSVSQIEFELPSQSALPHPIVSLFPSSSVDNEDPIWRRSVEFRTWDGIDPKSPKLCINAQSMWPSHPPFGACGDQVNSFDFWQNVVTSALKIDCVFSGSLVQKRTIFKLPPRNATFYIVFAISAPMMNTGTGVFNKKPYETESVRNARFSLIRWSLGRLRTQFGDSLELTVVQLDDSIVTESDFGIGNVNTLISSTMAEGQDWGMYQEGLHAVWHRIEAFEWVVLLNDQMVGPTTNFPQILNLSKGAGLWTTSTWAPCCIRGFAMGFSRSLIKTENWQTYWDRMQFVCAKIGPMYAGEEGSTRLKETQFHRIGGTCKTNSKIPIGKGHSLQKQRSDAPNSAFIYRWGLENEFYPIGERQLSDNEIEQGTRKAIEFMESIKIDPFVEDCGVQH
jgi:hypothetical protein